MRNLVLHSILALLFSTAVVGETIHVVQPGETLSSIAAAKLGSATLYRRIAEFNGLANPNAVRIGQRLRIPEPGEAAGAPAPPKPTSPHATGPSVPTSTAPAIEAPLVELAIVDIDGEAAIIRGGTVVPATVGSRLRSGDSIRTQSRTRVLLAGMTGERYDIGPATSVLLQEISSTSADRRVTVRVDFGELRFTAPETPFLVRYSIESPSGSLNLHHGDLLAVVAPPETVVVSVFEGNVTASLPRGSVEIAAGNGAVLRTLDPPGPLSPLPQPPGISVETSNSSLIMAAAVRPGQSTAIDVFRDRSLQRHVVRRTTTGDRMGVGLTRVELPASQYWLSARTISEAGLSSRPATSGPFTLSGGR